MVNGADYAVFLNTAQVRAHRYAFYACFLWFRTLTLDPNISAGAGLKFNANVFELALRTGHYSLIEFCCCLIARTSNVCGRCCHNMPVLVPQHRPCA